MVIHFVIRSATITLSKIILIVSTVNVLPMVHLIVLTIHVEQMAKETLTKRRALAISATITG